MTLKDLPELEFVSTDADALELEVVSAVETLLGRKLARADPLRIFLKGVEAVLLQQRALINHAAKQNLLAYAEGAYLDHIGALVGLARKDAVAAKCTMRLTLSTPREIAVIIPRGTRFTAGDNIFFALEEDVTFLAGQTALDASAACLSPGLLGNDYAQGEINQIVDPKPFLQTAVNITKSEGGSDIETDDEFRERIHSAPESFSTAGPRGAYRFHAMNTSPLISDVSVRCPTDANGSLRAGVVEIRPLLIGGRLPEQQMLDAVFDAVNADYVRPLTDKVEVLAPDVVRFDVDFSYRIARSDAAQAAVIQAAVNDAVDEYVKWQRAELGRDIEPSELIYAVRKVGAKHINLRQPSFSPVKSFEVALAENTFVSFLGIEDD